MDNTALMLLLGSGLMLLSVLLGYWISMKIEDHREATRRMRRWR